MFHLPSGAASPPAPDLRPPAPHPMDPRRGPGLSPAFSALLCWLLDLPAMTDPAVVGAAVTGDCVFLATTEDPFYNSLLGSWQDCQANLRGWGEACEAPAQTVEALIDRVRQRAP